MENGWRNKIVQSMDKALQHLFPIELVRIVESYHCHPIHFVPFAQRPINPKYVTWEDGVGISNNGSCNDHYFAVMTETLGDIHRNQTGFRFQLESHTPFPGQSSFDIGLFIWQPDVDATCLTSLWSINLARLNSLRLSTPFYVRCKGQRPYCETNRDVYFTNGVDNTFEFKISASASGHLVELYAFHGGIATVLLNHTDLGQDNWKRYRFIIRLNRETSLKIV